jgi:protein TonB
VLDAPYNGSQDASGVRRAGAFTRPDPARYRRAMRNRVAGSLAMSVLGHGALLAAGLVGALLLPSSPPAPTASPPAFAVELVIAPAPAAPASADMAAMLPLPEAPSAPVLEAAQSVALGPSPQPPPSPAAQPATSRIAPSVPPLPLPPGPPPRPQPPARPAAARQALVAPNPVQGAASALPAPAADAAPMLIANPRFRVPPQPPVYPRRAVQQRAEGEALIGALLDPGGAPHEVRVLRSSGHALLDRAALEAVGGWVFEPGRRAGQPVAARVEIPVRFTLR